MCVTAALIFGLSDARAADGGSPPLFGAFKAFCADTEARSESVKAAVLAAGGVPHNPPARSVETPFFMQSSLWDVKAGGHALVVAAGLARTNGEAAITMADCVISGTEADAASLAALAAWAGVPANADANKRIAYYVFENKNGAHQVISDGKAAQQEGRIWRLTVIRGPGVSSVELMHLMAPGQ